MKRKRLSAALFGVKQTMVQQTELILRTSRLLRVVQSPTQVSKAETGRPRGEVM